MNISAEAAVARLREGNERFVGNRLTLDISAAARRDIAAGQQPVAVVLGCSDARVPVEVVFDQGLGELFVIRVAGNIVQPSQIGSVEFAAQKFGTRLVVVLGHSRCGAVEATVDLVLDAPDEQSRNMEAIVSQIRPCVEALYPEITDRDELVCHAVRRNVHYSVQALAHGSTIIERLIDDGRLSIVGAEYSLETGVVEFLDVAPAR